MPKIFDKFKSREGFIENNPGCIDNVIMRGRYIYLRSKRTINDELVMTKENKINRLYRDCVMESDSINKAFKSTLSCIFEKCNLIIDKDDDRFICKKEIEIENVPFIRYGYGMHYYGINGKTIDKGFTIDVVRDKYPYIHKECEAIVNGIYNAKKDAVVKTDYFYIYDVSKFDHRIDVSVKPI